MLTATLSYRLINKVSCLICNANRSLHCFHIYVSTYIYLHNVFTDSIITFLCKDGCPNCPLPVVMCNIKRQILLQMFCTKLLSIFLGDIDTKKRYCHLIISRKSIQAAPTQENRINVKQVGYSTEICHRRSQA